MGAIKELTIDNELPIMQILYGDEEVLALPLLDWAELCLKKTVNENSEINKDEDNS